MSEPIKESKMKELISNTYLTFLKQKLQIEIPEIKYNSDFKWNIDIHHPPPSGTAEKTIGGILKTNTVRWDRCALELLTFDPDKVKARINQLIDEGVEIIKNLPENRNNFILELTAEYDPITIQVITKITYSITTIPKINIRVTK